MTPMSPSQPQLPSAAALALLPFEAALFVVSNYLAEARMASETPDFVRAERCYAAAEACAVKTGYVELMQLVWSDIDGVAAPPKSRALPPFGAAFPFR